MCAFPQRHAPIKADFKPRASASFHPPSFAQKQARIPLPNKKELNVNKEQSNSAWQEFLAKQQQHNKHIIETNRQLAIAMTLPQTNVPTFAGDPLEYQQFMIE